MLRVLCSPTPAAFRDTRGLSDYLEFNHIIEHWLLLIGKHVERTVLSRFVRSFMPGSEQLLANVRNIGILSCLVWAAASGSRAVRLYFALPRLPDLSDSAKDLLVAATDGKRPQPLLAG